MDPTLWTIRLALAAYFLACAFWLMRSARAARSAWIAGCAAYLAHAAAAFHWHYGWSHAVAVQETARQARALTGVVAGYGIWLNYAFCLLWAQSAIAVWRSGRPPLPWIHAVFLFMIVNGAIVFAAGPVRWATIGGYLGLLLIWAWRRRRPSIPLEVFRS
jgi:hypothetical protein